MTYFCAPISSIMSGVLTGHNSLQTACL